jgi:hypothetical protein
MDHVGTTTAASCEDDDLLTYVVSDDALEVAAVQAATTMTYGPHGTLCADCN